MNAIKSLVMAVCMTAAAAVAAGSARAQAAAPTPNAETKVALPNGPQAVLNITAAGEASNRVGEPVFVNVSVRNVSNVDVTLKNLVVRVDMAVASRFEGETKCDLQQFGEPKLRRGDIYAQTCRFQMKPLFDSGGLWSLIDSLFSLDIRLDVVADVVVPGDVQAKLSSYPSFVVRGPDFSIFVGGAFGAMLLAFFVWIERTLKDTKTFSWCSFGMMGLLGFRGGLLAIIALMLGKTTQGTGSPVSLTVVDFTGGVLVGLFSYPLASWISSTLKLDNVFSERSASATPSLTAAPTVSGEAVPAEPQISAPTPAATAPTHDAAAATKPVL